MYVVKAAVSMKTVASEAIYRKALRLSSSGKGTTSTGQLLNVMSTDTQAILMFTISSMMILMVPIFVRKLVENDVVDYCVYLAGCCTDWEACLDCCHLLSCDDSPSIYLCDASAETSSKYDEDF